MRGFASFSIAGFALVIGWLLNTTASLTPLELTLKIWAALSGDALGAGPLASIEAYLRRMMAGQPAKNRPAFEQMAAQAVLAGQAVVERRLAESWPAIQVLYISGYTDDTILRQGMLNEGTEFLSKPLRPEELLKKVRTLLMKAVPQNLPDAR